MNKADLLITNCSHLLTCHGPIPKTGSALQDVGLIENGSIASYQGKIVHVGSETEFYDAFRLTADGFHLDGTGQTALPGFVDSHTHLPFAGSREKEFVLRLKGYSYQELTEMGLGIQTSVKSTRQASLQTLISLGLSRLDSMLKHGTTTVEAKSGYGLNLDDELKQLEALKMLNQQHPCDIVSTFMGAHEVPPEYKTRKDEYIKLLTHDILPEVKNRSLAEFFDVFCEEGVFSIEESRNLIQAAKQAGFKIKMHADEFAPLGGAQLAAEEGAVSADHLIAITDEGIAALAASGTTATLLPGVSFFLMQERKAPARKLIEAGAIVALATDFNPGSSMTESMFFVMQLAVFTLKMSIEEAVNAATANAAYALDRHRTVGSLELGKNMDLILCNCLNYPYLVYHFGINPITTVIKHGKVVVSNGNVERTDSSRGRSL